MPTKDQLTARAQLVRIREAILGGVALAVGAWFLAHRHGQLKGLLAAQSSLPSIGSAKEGAASPVTTASK